MKSCIESLGGCRSATKEGAEKLGVAGANLGSPGILVVGALKAASTVTGSRLSNATLASSSLF